MMMTERGKFMEKRRKMLVKIIIVNRVNVIIQQQGGGRHMPGTYISNTTEDFHIN